MFEQPGARLDRQFRQQSKPNYVLGPSVLDRVTLEGIGTRDGCRQEWPRPKPFVPGSPDLFAFQKTNAANARFASLSPLDHREQSLESVQFGAERPPLHHD